MAETNEPERRIGNAIVEQHENLVNYEKDDTLFLELLKSSDKVADNFEHRARNEYLKEGAWVKMTKTVMVKNEAGEIYQQEIEIDPIMNDTGIARFKLYLAQVNEHVATSNYKPEQADRYVIDELYNIGLIVRINAADYDIKPEDMPLITSIIGNSMEACVYKAVNAKTLDAISRQSQYSEVLTEDKKKHGSLKGALKKLVGG